MDFELNEDQQLIREIVRDFAENKIKPGVAARDEEERFISDLLPGLAELGLLGMATPERYGGSGLDYLSSTIVIEELARVCPSTSVTVSVTNSVCQSPIVRFGSEEQKKKYLPPLACGEQLGGLGLTEPNAGSDAGALKTRAVRRGDVYILNGSKAWITNTHVGRVFIVIAVTDPEKGKRGISAFIVTPEMKGFEFLPHEKKMGLRASVTSGIAFEDCVVPADNLLGEEGMGLEIALNTLDGSRIGIAAQAVGIAQGAFEEAVRYSTQRESFGKPIALHGAIQEMISEAATRVEGARLLTYRAAAMHALEMAKIGNPGLSRASAMAKLFASETADFVCDTAVQIHGAYGYSREYAIERFYRDARVTRIYEGTSEVQRIVIARSLLS